VRIAFIATFILLNGAAMHFSCKISFIVFAMLLQISVLMAQPDYFQNSFKHKKDSLIEVLKKYPNPDTARAKALFKIIDCAAFLKEKKEVMPYWEEAIKLSRKLKYRKMEAACLVWKGGYYKSAQKIDSAFAYIDSGIQVVNNSGDIRLKYSKAFGYYLKGMIYENQENLYVALQNYFEALKNYDSTLAFMQKSIYSRIAIIYQTLNNDDKALEYYKLADIGAYTAIAEIYFKRNDLSDAKFYLDKLKSLMPDTVNTQFTGSYYSLLGNISEKQKQPDSALIYLKEALKYFKYNRFMHTDPIANVLNDITRLEMKKGDMAKAKDYAAQALAAAKESNHKETMAGALKAMAEYDNKTGNPSVAYQALQQATMLNDSVLTEANIKQANTLAAIYENDKKEKAITQLQADKKIQAAAVKQKSLLNIVFITALAALLITGILLFRNVKHKQMLGTQQQLIQRQKITQLEKEKQLMAVEAMLKGQEEERARLAKDLHDGLGGMLSGVKISFSNMKENMIMDAANLAIFEKSIAKLDSTIEELRKVSHNLMPEALVKFGLKSAVKDFCDSMQSSDNVKIVCEQSGTERELGNIVDVNVYRIIQELVSNAVKHAEAEQILLQVIKTPNKVLITVEDNGKGFEINALEETKGIGLANIKYRVNYLKGTIEINSKPGDGTTVNIELTA
jgi:two-component system, NarL family, sensor kinase